MTIVQHLTDKTSIEKQLCILKLIYTVEPLYKGFLCLFKMSPISGLSLYRVFQKKMIWGSHNKYFQNWHFAFAALYFYPWNNSSLSTLEEELIEP